MVQLVPLPPHQLFASLNPDWFNLFLVLAYPGCLGEEAVKRMSVY